MEDDLSEGEIKFIKYGDKYAQVEVVVKVGSINIIVTKKRKPYNKKKVKKIIKKNKL